MDSKTPKKGDKKIRLCKHHGETTFVYRDNRWRCLKCGTEAVIKRRKVLKEKAVEYKGGKCYRCGYNKCIEALEFHHIDSTEKDFGIAQKGYTRSWEKVKDEFDKCVLVCCNCHRELHSEQRNLLKD